MQSPFSKPFGLAKRSLNIVMVLVLLQTSFLMIRPQSVTALSGSDFAAGNIIADGVFYDGQDMTLYDIQNFLNSKVPVCDTSGAQTYSPGVTRASYGTSTGHPPPYTCLKDFHQDVPERSAESGLCTGIGAGIKSAAQIIQEVGISCNINPKTLLVLLQKEQALVTDDWPWATQYQRAAGYGCPDTAPCDALYYGFFNQVYMAARQYRRYAHDANLFNYRPFVNNNIWYRPDISGTPQNEQTDCGRTAVYINNYATAGLYNYTPYQPNAAALANLNGLGDACSSYGNRNFWRLYNDWFGSTQVSGICTGTETPQTYVRRFYNPRTFQHFYSAYDCDIKFLTRLGYIDEGAAFNTTPSSAPWAVPVYRYYNPQTHIHIWSIDYLTPQELAAGGTGYQQEAGIVFYVARSDMPNVHPIRQFYNPNTYLHLLAPDPSPQDVVFLKEKGGYDIEGIVFTSQ